MMDRTGRIGALPFLPSPSHAILRIFVLAALALVLLLPSQAHATDCTPHRGVCTVAEAWKCCAYYKGGTPIKGGYCNTAPNPDECVGLEATVVECAHNWECRSDYCQYNHHHCADALCLLPLTPCDGGNPSCANCCSGAYTTIGANKYCTDKLTHAGDPCPSNAMCYSGVCNAAAGKCYKSSGLEDGAQCSGNPGGCKSTICDFTSLLPPTCKPFFDGFGTDFCQHDYDCASNRCTPDPVLKNFTCASCAGTGGACNANADCCTNPSQLLCTEPNGGGAKTCQACIHEGSPTACTDSSQCCSGVPCTGGVCTSQPAPPVAAVIAPTVGGTFYNNSSAHCTLNCPPAVLPPNTLMKYRWVRESSSGPIYGSWSNPSPAPYTATFSCSGVCSPGDEVYLESSACDLSGTCSDTSESNSLAVQQQSINQPPAPAPAKPTLAPLSVYVNGVVSCASGCPPNPPPTDPENGAVTFNYVWYVNDLPANPDGTTTQQLAKAESQYFLAERQLLHPFPGKGGAWLAGNTGGDDIQSNAVTYNCLAKGCSVNDKIRLQVEACDPQDACSVSPVSNPATVVCSAAGGYCSINAHCCGSMTCNVAAHTCQGAPNTPPSAPARPAIAPMTAFVKSVISCTQNCPGGSLDPEGDPITYYFRWYKNGLPWADGWVAYDSGSIITPPAEEEMSGSNSESLKAVSLAANSHAGSINPHQARLAAPGPLPTPTNDDYDCALENCNIGNTIKMQTRACDDSNACTNSELSFAATVVCSTSGNLCRNNADCCTGLSCTAGHCYGSAQIPPSPPSPVPTIVSASNPFYPDGTVHCTNCPLNPGGVITPLQGPGGIPAFTKQGGRAAYFSSAAGGTTAYFANYIPPTPTTPHVRYRWVAGNYLSPWSISHADLSCPSIGGCQPFQQVYLQAKTCTGSGVCSSSVQSNVLVPDMFPLPEPPPLPVCGNESFTYVFLMCLLASMGMACIIALAYMGAEATNNARVLAWSKEEALQLFASITFVAVILFVLSTMCSVKVGEIHQIFGLNAVQEVFSGVYSASSFQQGAMYYLQYLGNAGDRKSVV